MLKQLPTGFWVIRGTSLVFGFSRGTETNLDGHRSDLISWNQELEWKLRKGSWRWSIVWKQNQHHWGAVALNSYADHDFGWGAPNFPLSEIPSHHLHIPEQLPSSNDLLKFYSLPQNQNFLTKVRCLPSSFWYVTPKNIWDLVEDKFYGYVRLITLIWAYEDLESRLKFKSKLNSISLSLLTYKNSVSRESAESMSEVISMPEHTLSISVCDAHLSD